MNHAMQVDVIKELIDHIDHQRTVDIGRVLMNPASSYTDEALAAREWDIFFANHPQIIACSGELPGPGSYLTLDDFGVPILATRDAQGRFRAFVNACRHRGAQVATDARGTKSRFTCPFHAWTYGSDGQLIRVRAADQFGKIDPACHGLIELPAAEKYGLLFVHPRRDGELDIDALLGEELCHELASWDLGRAEYAGASVIDKPPNWKIANDTFGEVYHFNSLHKSTLSNLLHGDFCTYKEFGRNHRMCLASKYIDVMRQQPEAQWNLPMAGAILYHLFPNVELAILNPMMVLVRIYPERNKVGRSISRISHYAAPHLAPQLAVVERVSELSSDNLYRADTSAPIAFSPSAISELFVSTVEHEDYLMGAKTQVTAESGRIEHFLFGRNEPALHHFHNNYRCALGMPPLEEYRAG